ncbi:adenylyl-sulfate kinase [Methylophaga nitratireducenticrescens]|uniref:adenylyl-sulfate kinase n=1 Tax=Methylophaga nitratireducenticrescens TaxID=754476 RepID=UPI000CDCD744|nr:adenylyl-sulfate kinase [Methylophaga nitratireducenticrescens]AUZ84051.1 hypothetical protein CDW43_05460 [Methylophaga nitratireducenticrescens]
MNSIVEPKGGVIWITGYSGAGKTTIARMVSQKLKQLGLPVVSLDGDEIRSILGERYGHQLEERKQLSYVYSRLCKKIADDNVTVVIAAVAMFEAVRKENRAANEHYLEVYLDVPFQVRQSRDPKGLYKALTEKNINESDFISGLEIPANPDMTINNFGEITPEKSANEIVEKYVHLTDCKKENLLTKEASTNPQDKKNERAKYWDEYYQKRKAPISPSTFALFCAENYINTHCHLLEFGCGNGRDAFYFSKFHRVTAIDASGTVVESNKVRANQEGILNIDFLHGEFGTSIVGLPKDVDVIYARFVLHAMPENIENQALEQSWKLLRDEGKLLLEFRTTQDPLMEKGQSIGDTERVTDHYRRFINFSNLCEKLEKIGFKIDYKIEKQGLAAYGDDDPVVGRVVAVKNNR